MVHIKTAFPICSIFIKMDVTSHAKSEIRQFAIGKSKKACLKYEWTTRPFHARRGLHDLSFRALQKETTTMQATKYKIIMPNYQRSLQKLSYFFMY